MLPSLRGGPGRWRLGRDRGVRAVRLARAEVPGVLLLEPGHHGGGPAALGSAGSPSSHAPVSCTSGRFPNLAGPGPGSNGPVTWRVYFESVLLRNSSGCLATIRDTGSSPLPPAASSSRGEDAESLEHAYAHKRSLSGKQIPTPVYRASISRAHTMASLTRIPAGCGRVQVTPLRRGGTGGACLLRGTLRRPPANVASSRTRALTPAARRARSRDTPARCLNGRRRTAGERPVHAPGRQRAWPIITILLPNTG